jgi:GT2 family glycosyltransferase
MQDGNTWTINLSTFGQPVELRATMIFADNLSGQTPEQRVSYRCSLPRHVSIHRKSRISEPINAEPLPNASHYSQSDPPPLIGIVILNWNGWRDTMNAVSSTHALTWPRLRVYVVDNGSTDGSEEKLRAWAPELTIIQSGNNLGWSGGNNVGIRAALSDGCAHVLLLNNDATIRPNALTLIADVAEAHPDTASIGALIVSAHDPGLVEFAGTHVDARSSMPQHSYGKLSELNLASDPVPVVAVKGCAMLLTATGLSRVGLLTEDYFLNYDEMDWCYRATALGLDHFLVSRAVVEHKGGVSFGGCEGPLYRYFITRNQLVFARRHLSLKGRWFAWRCAFWQLRQAPDDGVTWFQSCVTVLLAVADYCRGRLGDCPPLIRKFNRRGSPG